MICVEIFKLTTNIFTFYSQINAVTLPPGSSVCLEVFPSIQTNVENSEGYVYMGSEKGNEEETWQVALDSKVTELFNEARKGRPMIDEEKKMKNLKNAKQIK